MGQDWCDRSHLHLEPVLGAPGAPSLGTTVLACGVNLCPRAELEGLPGGWSLDSPFFACHSSCGCLWPCFLFQQSMRENKEKQALSDLMIKPVQRIPRYELLVKVGKAWRLVGMQGALRPGPQASVRKGSPL